MRVCPGVIVRIRKARRRDFKELVYLDGNSGHVFYEKNPKWKKAIPQWLKPIFLDKINEFYVYGAGGRILGAVSLRKTFSAPNSSEINYLAVLKEEHGKGIGSNLIRFVEGRAKELGFERIFLYTSFDNRGAQRFYERLGYKKINEFPRFYSWGDTAFLYGKQFLKESYKIKGLKYVF